MTFTMSQIEIAGTLSTGPVIHLDNIAKRICHDALEQTYDKLAPVEQELSLERLLQRRALFQSFKYGLAKGVAETLAANDKRVRAVYVFEPSANPDAEAEEDLPLKPPSIGRGRNDIGASGALIASLIAGWSNA